MNIKLEELRFNRSVLYHGIRHENFEKWLFLGSKIGTTSQRYWHDGKIRDDSHHDYEQSYWMFGWSMSRDKYLASKFADILIVFDRDYIKERFEIRPLSWSYRVSKGSGYFKKEREDFVVGYKNQETMEETKESFAEYKDKYFEIMEDKSNDNLINLMLMKKYDDLFDYHKEGAGKNKKKLNINDSMIGFYIKDTAFLSEKEIKTLTNHKLFMGFYNGEDAENKLSLSQSEVYCTYTLERNLKRKKSYSL